MRLDKEGRYVVVLAVEVTLWIAKHLGKPLYHRIVRLMFSSLVLVHSRAGRHLIDSGQHTRFLLRQPID